MWTSEGGERPCEHVEVRREGGASTIVQAPTVGRRQTKLRKSGRGGSGIWEWSKVCTSRLGNVHRHGGVGRGERESTSQSPCRAEPDCGADAQTPSSQSREACAPRPVTVNHIDAHAFCEGGSEERKREAAARVRALPQRRASPRRDGQPRVSGSPATRRRGKNPTKTKRQSRGDSGPAPRRAAAPFSLFLCSLSCHLGFRLRSICAGTHACV